MVEFGEQLRWARERKGMTQQSLAEKLFVTRQSVSRWECGDRYPDLLMTKNISKILEVSLDELLSDDDMENMIKRNPIIEKPAVNKLILLLYGVIAVLYISTVMDLIIRLPGQSERMSALLAVPVILQAFDFVYGFVAAINQSLSPMRTGFIVSTFFLSLALKDAYYLFLDQPVSNVFVVYLLILPNILGTLAAIEFFVKSKIKKVWIVILFMACINGMIRLISKIYHMIVYLGEYLTMNNTIHYIVNFLIYILILYQAYMFLKKQSIYRKVRNKSK